MEDTSVFATVLLPIALAAIMFTLGLTLKTADFRRIATQPRGVAIGLTNLLVISPLLAFAVATLYDLEPALAVGLVLLGASPGGTMANLLTHLARGDVALSVTMTAISSVAAVVTVPTFLALAVSHFDATVADNVSMGGVVARVFLITIVPLSAGMWYRARDEVRAAALEPRLKQVAFTVFLLVVIGAVVSEFETIADNFGILALATLTLNVAAMTASRHRPRGQPERPPGHRDRHGAGGAQQHPCDSRRLLHRRGAEHPGGRLQRLHVHHRGAVRPSHVPPQRRCDLAARRR